MIRNPYRHDIDLANLIYNANADSILLELIDKDYVLVMLKPIDIDVGLYKENMLFINNQHIR